MLLIARGDPKARMSAFVLEQLDRARLSSVYHNGTRARSSTLLLPWRQPFLADIVGLSAVHVSRTLTHFKQTDLVDRPTRDVLVVKDERALRRLSGLDGSASGDFARPDSARNAADA